MALQLFNPVECFCILLDAHFRSSFVISLSFVYSTILRRTYNRPEIANKDLVLKSQTVINALFALNSSLFRRQANQLNNSQRQFIVCYKAQLCCESNGCLPCSRCIRKVPILYNQYLLVVSSQSDKLSFISEKVSTESEFKCLHMSAPAASSSESEFPPGKIH